MEQIEYLINEIKEFYDTNGRVPEARDMKVKYGYSSIREFRDEFGSWNNAVEAAGFKVRNKKVVGNRVCAVCGTKETSRWCNSDKGIICRSCYRKPDYKTGRLDVNSAVGKGFVGERVVAAVLGISFECDCNLSKSFTHPEFDMVQLHDEKYGKIQVKTSELVEHGGSSRWYFNLGNKCDNYIMLGFSGDMDNIIKVWIIPSDRNIVNYRMGLAIIFNPKKIREVVREIVKYEVDAKLYNDVYHNMSLDGCNTLIDKNKSVELGCVA